MIFPIYTAQHVGLPFLLIKPDVHPSFSDFLLFLLLLELDQSLISGIEIVPKSLSEQNPIVGNDNHGETHIKLWLKDGEEAWEERGEVVLLRSIGDAGCTANEGDQSSMRRVQRAQCRGGVRSRKMDEMGG